jgi:tripartite-type tricarboxylate transporter receptor subunit TctC
VSDITLRTLGERLSTYLHVPIVIENQVGGHGVAAAQSVMSAAPDGYTLSLGGNNWAIDAEFLKGLRANPLKEFVPVVGISDFPYLFVTNQSSKYRTLQEVISTARAKPNTLNFGTSQPGTTNYMAAILFKSVLNLDVAVVPYRGPSELMVALLQNDLDVVVNAYGGLKSGILQGQIRALATTAKVRSKLFPDVPTVMESGVPDYDASSWNSLYAPARTPPEAIQVVQKAVLEVLAENNIKTRFHDLGIEVMPYTAEQVDARMRSDTAKWAKVLAQAGIETK